VTRIKDDNEKRRVTVELARHAEHQPMDSAKEMPSVSALDLRRLRDQVRYTASLLSGFRPVYEQLHVLWACDFHERVIYWRPTSPVPPFDVMSPRDILFLIAHESGHLNFTGGWDVPDDWKLNKRMAFKGFLNAVEDIRIERLMGVQFPGFEEIRRPVNNSFLKFHEGSGGEDYAVWHQVGLNWIAIENNDKATIGHKESKKFAEDLWPEITRIANADSTQDLSVPLIPIFEMLWQEQDEEEQQKKKDGEPQGNYGGSLGDPQEGSGGGEGSSEGEGGKGESKDGQSGGGKKSDQFKGIGQGDPFNDEPSKDPRNDRPFDTDTMTREEQLKQIERDSKGAGKRKVGEALAGERQAREQAKEDNRKVQGNSPQDGEGGIEAGTEPAGYRKPSNHWALAKDRMDPKIRALSHRLRTVLKNNAMSNWQEGQRRGRLNSHRAYKSQVSPRIMRKRHSIGSLDYTFGIINDTSGSMQSPQIPYMGKNAKLAMVALDATVLVAEALDKANLPYFLIEHCTRLHTVKKFDDKLRPLAENVGADIALSSGGTYEAPALIVAQEEFRKVRSGHKMLFVISDGHTSGIDESVQLVQEMLREGVHVVALGLGIDPPAHHPVRIRVDDLSHLPEMLPKLINEVVRKGAN